ncbi:MAG: SGNH/GDSL hydrolase family protein, partial [Armatimonadetes bacterium]|nr:SGNH/GDSL hydrolase family protein [Anaerolineae bacterium]
YDPIGRGYYNLGDYAGLQAVITHYSGTLARDQNSFANTSLAAGPGWTTATALDPAYANPSVCAPGETPLACEYRLTLPAVALIMLGSNDVQYFGADTYAANLDRITQMTVDAGVIPILSTLPPRIGYEGQVDAFNTVVRETAARYGVPLWDYYGVMASLPNSGLSGDGLHPSTSPRGYEGAADFSGDNLAYGYVMRNLTALQALDAVWRRVLLAVR